MKKRAGHGSQSEYGVRIREVRVYVQMAQNAQQYMRIYSQHVKVGMNLGVKTPQEHFSIRQNNR